MFECKGQPGSQVQYLAKQLGHEGIRANCISAGPIKPCAATGIADFNKLLSYKEKHAPLKRNVVMEEVCNNVAAFLCM